MDTFHVGASTVVIGDADGNQRRWVTVDRKSKYHFDDMALLDSHGNLIGRMIPFGNEWYFVTETKRIDLGISLEEYHWNNIRLAEIEIIKHVLEG